MALYKCIHCKMDRMGSVYTLKKVYLALVLISEMLKPVT